LQSFDGGFGVAGLQQIAPLHEQGVAFAGIEREHALQNFFGGAEPSLWRAGFGGGGENLPGVILFSEADVDFRQADAHGGIFRIHFQNLLEDADGVIQFVGLQEFFGYLQVLGAGRR